MNMREDVRLWFLEIEERRLAKLRDQIRSFREAPSRIEMEYNEFFTRVGNNPDPRYLSAEDMEIYD